MGSLIVCLHEINGGKGSLASFFAYVWPFNPIHVLRHHAVSLLVVTGAVGKARTRVIGLLAKCDLTTSLSTVGMVCYFNIGLLRQVTGAGGILLHMEILNETGEF